jgi:hypothetical protein
MLTLKLVRQAADQRVIYAAQHAFRRAASEQTQVEREVLSLFVAHSFSPAPDYLLSELPVSSLHANYAAAGAFHVQRGGRGTSVEVLVTMGWRGIGQAPAALLRPTRSINIKSTKSQPGHIDTKLVKGVENI